MSDDEADPELLALLRQSLGLGPGSATAPPDTGVLRSAEYVYDNAVDVSISSQHTKAAAGLVWKLMQEREYSTHQWSQHELHPSPDGAEETVNFIFVMDLLNFSFWSDLPDDQRFAIEYKGRRWTGYWSLVAALRRALEAGFPITTPSFYASKEWCPDSVLEYIFHSSTAEPIPMLAERAAMLREAGQVLASDFGGSIVSLIHESDKSAARLVNLLTAHFECFNDIHPFQGKQVKFHKRAQIFVADLWACFNGTSFGEFEDIDHLTMFADYRVPQMLESMGCLWYSPRLESKLKRHEVLQSGEILEVELRGCSIWCVELLKREIERRFISEIADSRKNVNSVLIDFLLYDVAKEREKKLEDMDVEDGGEVSMELSHHRTRSIWY